MSANAENGLSFFSRLRKREEVMYFEVMSDTNGFVINITETHLKDINVFINSIIKNIFNKNLKCSQSSKSDYTSEEDEQMAIIHRIDRYDRSQTLLLMSQLEDELDSADDISPPNPMIMVFDACHGFNLKTLSAKVSDRNHLKHVIIFEAKDSTQLLSSIKEELALNLALNPDLKLVVIYAISSNICQKIVDQIIQLLSSLVISVRIVLVVDRITKIQSNEFTKRLKFEILSVKYLASNQMEIQSNRNNKTFITSVIS